MKDNNFCTFKIFYINEYGDIELLFQKRVCLEMENWDIGLYWLDTKQQREENPLSTLLGGPGYLRYIWSCFQGNLTPEVDSRLQCSSLTTKPGAKNFFSCVWLAPLLSGQHKISNCLTTFCHRNWEASESCSTRYFETKRSRFQHILKVKICVRKEALYNGEEILACLQPL